MLASTVLGPVSDLLRSIEGMQVINGGEHAVSLRQHDLLADQRIGAPTKCEYGAKATDNRAMSAAAIVLSCLASGME